MRIGRCIRNETSVTVEVPASLSPSLQRHPADCTYFDPIMTALPPTLSEMASTCRELCLEGFKFSIHSRRDDAAEP